MKVLNSVMGQWHFWIMESEERQKLIHKTETWQVVTFNLPVWSTGFMTAPCPVFKLNENNDEVDSLHLKSTAIIQLFFTTSADAPKSQNLHITVCYWWISAEREHENAAGGCHSLSLSRRRFNDEFRWHLTVTGIRNIMTSYSVTNGLFFKAFNFDKFHHLEKYRTKPVDLLFSEKGAWLL